MLKSGASKNPCSKVKICAALASQISTTTSGVAASISSTHSGLSGVCLTKDSTSPEVKRSRGGEASASPLGSMSIVVSPPSSTTSAAGAAMDTGGIVSSGVSLKGAPSLTATTAAMSLLLASIKAAHPRPVVSPAPSLSARPPSLNAAGETDGSLPVAAPTCKSDSTAQSAKTSVLSSKLHPSDVFLSSQAPSPAPNDSANTCPSASSKTIRTLSPPENAKCAAASPFNSPTETSSPLANTRSLNSSPSTSSADHAIEPVTISPSPKPMR